MNTFIIDYGTGIIVRIEAEDLNEVKDIAYENISYTQQDVSIKDADENVIATSEWHGVAPDVDGDDDILCIIGNGHYLLWDDELLWLNFSKQFSIRSMDLKKFILEHMRLKMPSAEH